MTEDTIITLLTNVTRRLIRVIAPEWTDEQVQALASTVADGSWNALVFLLREALAREAVVTLGEFGTFKRESDSSVSFQPAASLLEAASAHPDVDSTPTALATRALYLIREGLTAVRYLPKDIAVFERSHLGPRGDEATVGQWFGRDEALTLGAELRAIAAQIQQLTVSPSDEPSSVTSRPLLLDESFQEGLSPTLAQGSISGTDKAEAEEPERRTELGENW